MSGGTLERLTIECINLLVFDHQQMKMYIFLYDGSFALLDVPFRNLSYFLTDQIYSAKKKWDSEAVR
jgi:hypothetical protein